MNTALNTLNEELGEFVEILKKERMIKLSKNRLFNLMDAIENRTGKMMHELDNQRFTRIMDTLQRGKVGMATVALANWYDEVS